MRAQSLDIYQLIEIATALVLQRKKLPGEDLCGPIQPKSKGEELLESIEFHSAYLL